MAEYAKKPVQAPNLKLAASGRPASKLNGAPVSIVNIEKSFAEVGAVKSVSLDIAAGEFVTFVGPSGSGKTTTLMMVAGFVKPTSGEIFIDGKPILHLAPYKRNIGMVFQSYALFPHMTVGENIAFPLKQRHMNRTDIAREVEAALNLIRLAGYADRYPAQLSGGQQQRVALARALVFRPPLLLMDEPLGALDKQLREEMQFEIRRLQSDLGITCIYVTHDQEEALTMSTRVAVMRDGLVEQLGSPEALYERPKNAFVASFLGESSFFNGTVSGLMPDGSAMVKVREHTLRAVAQRTLVPGEEITMAVRPQKMSVVSASNYVEFQSEARNFLSGTVREAIFMGESWRFVIDTDLGNSVVVKQLQRHNLVPPRPGETVKVEWHFQDTVLL